MQLLPKATYLSVIKNSVGSQMFRHNYALVDGDQVDILQDGQLSCAFFASFILRAFSLIQTLHARTEGTIADMETSGWRKTDDPHEGDIVVWEAAQQKTGVYPHIGFYIDSKTAISHWDAHCAPTEHSLLFENHDTIAAFYTHDFLT